jgi:hypothetical protein
MDLKELGQSIVKYGAPALGMALGGAPGAALAASLAAKFNSDSSPEDLLKAITLDPQAEIKLKEIESQERISLQGFATDLLKTQINTEVADRASAREADVARKDFTARNLAYLITTFFFTFVIYFMWLAVTPHDAIDGNETTIINYILGVLTTTFTAIVSFYYGATYTKNN